MSGAEGEGESGGAIGVAIGSGMGAIGGLAVDANDALDGVEVFADIAADRNEERALLEGSSKAGVEFGFEGGSEVAEFEFGVGRGGSGR